MSKESSFTCCGGCLFNCLCTILVGTVAIFIFRPNPLKFYASHASLTLFNFAANNSTLYYNLALNFTIRNPNQRVGIYYDNIEVRASYHGRRLASTNLQPFYQGHKNTTNLDNIVLRGQSLVFFKHGVSKYNRDRIQGAFDIDVKLRLRLRFKVGLVKTTKFKPEIHCDLKLPLRTTVTSSSANNFESRRCDLDWH